MKTQVNKIKRNPKQFVHRRQRGNTLVPVVIGLGIAAVVTVGFLNQGQELTYKSKVVLASSEISSILTDWNLAEDANGTSRVATAIAAMGGNNVYGSSMTFGAASPGNANSATLQYPTDSTYSCDSLSSIFTGTVTGVESSSCNGGITLTLTLTGSAGAATPPVPTT
ncbi:MAG: hypothetical protein ACPG3V_08820 [Porticoccaceae bacterium]